MREKDALTDPQQQIKEAVGSGPFNFAKDQWVPGSKAVYLKNKDYVPRNEPPSSFAGGKVAGVDRIELVWISDPQTAMSALVNGEIDFCENPSIDFLPILEKAKGVKLLKTGKIDSTQGMIRLNHLHPPFNNIKARQAMYYLINQEDFLRAIIGDPKYYKVCHGLLTCGGPLENDAGTRCMQGVQSQEGAAAPQGGRLQRRADHRSCAATDHNTITPATQVLIQAMREAGINARRAVDGLGLGGLAPRQEGAAGAGRLEHLRHHHRAASARPTRCCTPGSARPATRACSAGRAIAEIEELRNAFGIRARPRTSARRSPSELQTKRDRAGRRTCRSASGTRRSPTAPTASTASCPTPAWRCCGASRRSDASRHAVPRSDARNDRDERH